MKARKKIKECKTAVLEALGKCTVGKPTPVPFFGKKCTDFLAGQVIDRFEPSKGPCTAEDKQDGSEFSDNLAGLCTKEVRSGIMIRRAVTDPVQCVDLTISGKCKAVERQSGKKPR